jgi:outer membrane autotransporter protein
VSLVTPTSAPRVISRADLSPDIELGGTGTGQFDQLKVTGNVSLAGTLNVSLVGSFVPATGDVFAIITFMGALSGDFTTKNFPALGGGNKFTTSSGSGNYTLTVTT